MITWLEITATSLYQLQIYDTPISSLSNLTVPTLVLLSLSNVTLSGSNPFSLLPNVSALQIIGGGISNLNLDMFP